MVDIPKVSRKPRAVALVPARSGSKRVAEKNIKPLAGHPLMAYAIAAALGSGVFDAVIVATDSSEYADIARYYGAEAPWLRPARISGELSPDIEWVEFILSRLRAEGRDFEAFSILRPTSPFRQAETIRRAWDAFLAEKDVDSLRAVEKCRQHPGKMWMVSGRRMSPLLTGGPVEQPWHSSQYQTLPEVYVQNASLEIAWAKVVFETRTIAGTAIMPFFTENFEGFDVNDPYDWKLAEELIAEGKAGPAPIALAPYADLRSARK